MTEQKRMVRQLVNEWDPANLMSHAPDDEYDHEVDEILTVAMNGVEVNQLGVAIRDIFLRTFGADRFKTPLSECLQVAQGVLRALRV